MIYYTADLHLGHLGIISMCQRPFRNLEEMHRTIIQNWNTRITPEDEVYIVGDVAYRCQMPDLETYLKQLPGHKHLIIGNHDRHNIKSEQFRAYFESIINYAEIRDQKNKVILCHYPILEWNGFFHGTYHIYGHIHNSRNMANQIMEQLPNAFNAGMDCNGFMPRTLAELIADHEKSHQTIPGAEL